MLMDMQYFCFVLWSPSLRTGKAESGAPQRADPHRRFGVPIWAMCRIGGIPLWIICTTEDSWADQQAFFPQA